MVEIIDKGLIKTKCKSCRVALMFQWSDMKYLTDKDIEYKLSPAYAKETRYIECPVCHEKIFVRNDESGWMNGTLRIYEDTNKEVQ